MGTPGARRRKANRTRKQSGNPEQRGRGVIGVFGGDEVRGDHSYPARALSPVSPRLSGFKIVPGTSSVPEQLGQLVTVIRGGVPHLKDCREEQDEVEVTLRAGLRGHRGKMRHHSFSLPPGLCIGVGTSRVPEQDRELRLCIRGQLEGMPASPAHPCLSWHGSPGSAEVSGPRHPWSLPWLGQQPSGGGTDPRFTNPRSFAALGERDPHWPPVPAGLLLHCEPWA